MAPDNPQLVVDGCLSSAPQQNVASKRYKRLAFLLERDGWHCWLCDQPFTNQRPPTLDHMLPRSMGGRNALDNMRLAHQKCNSRRGNRDGADWSRAHAGRSISEAPT